MNTLKHLAGLTGQWVTVKHPDAPHRVWQGRLVEVWDQWSIVLETHGGGRETFPAAFDVAPTTEPQPGPAGAPRPWNDLRTSGLLWLINRTALHPRGAALAVHTDDRGTFTGWSLITNADREPWQFDQATDTDGYERAEATLAAVLAPDARLLDCGLCYEEHGEEVHPHPECPKSSVPAAMTGGSHTDWGQLVEGTEGTPYPAGSLCCVCGGSPVAYDNYEGQLFCWRCADCDCGRNGPCIRTGIHRKRPGKCTATWHHPHRGFVQCGKKAGHYTTDHDAHVGQTAEGATFQWRDDDDTATPHDPNTEWACTATCLEPFHGRARCEQHADFRPDGRPGPWHQGTSEDGSTLFWKDGEPGTTRHRPDASPDTETNSPDTVRTAPVPDTDAPDLTSTDTVRTTGPDTAPDASATDSADSARTHCPDTDPDSPDTVRTIYTARVPRRQMSAALAEAVGAITRAQEQRRRDDTAAANRTAAEREDRTIREALARLSPDTTTAAPADADEPTDPGEDLTLGPDGLTDTERERKTIRDTLNTELSHDEPDAVWTLTLAVQRALHSMPRHNTRRPGDNLAHPTDTAQVTGPDRVDENPARLVHLVHGTIPLHEHLAGVERNMREITALRSRVGELADTLAEAISHFTIGGSVRNGYVEPQILEDWRLVHTGKSLATRTFPHVEGICPTCRRTGLFLGSGGYVYCSHDDCHRPDAAITVLKDPPSTAHTCNRAHCRDRLTKALEADRRATYAYELLRSDVTTAARFISLQQDVSPISPLRCNRARILTALTTWIKDPGPLTPPNTPTEER